MNKRFTIDETAFFEELNKLLAYCEEHADKKDFEQNLKIKYSGLGEDPPHIVCHGIDLSFRTGLSKINLSDSPIPA